MFFLSVELQVSARTVVLPERVDLEMLERYVGVGVGVDVDVGSVRTMMFVIRALRLQGGAWRMRSAVMAPFRPEL